MAEYPVNIRILLEYIGREAGKLAEDSLRSIQKLAMASTRGFGALSKSMVGVAAKTNMAAGAFTAVGVAVGAATFKLASTTARVNELAMASEVLGTRLGITRAEIDATAVALKKQGATGKAAYTLITEMVRGEIDLAKAVELATAARNMGVIADWSASESMEKIAYVLRSMYPWQLRQVGVSKQISSALREYAAQTDRNVRELTNLEQRQVIANTIIEEGAKFAGLHALATGNLTGAMREFGSTLTGISEELGTLFLPLINEIGVAWFGATVAFRNWLIEHKEGLASAGSHLAGFFVGLSQVIMSALKIVSDAAATLIMLPLTVAQDIGAMFGVGIKKAEEFGFRTTAMLDAVGKNITAMASSVGQGFSTMVRGVAQKEIPKIPRAVGEAAQEMSKKMKSALEKMRKDLEKENKRYAKSVADRAKAFGKSLARMIWAHIDKRDSLLRDLEEENDAYKKALADRIRDFEKAMAKMEKTHEKRAMSIQERIDDEEDDYTKSREKILKELEKEKKKGMWIEGFWNAHGKASRLADIQERLADLDDEHEKRMSRLKRALEEENEEYIEAVAERKEEHRLETTDMKEEHDERVGDLQTRLDKENAILGKHNADVLRIRQQQRLDDISELKIQHEEESAERLKAHNEKIKEIRERAKEAGDTYGSIQNKEITGWVNKTRAAVDEALDNMSDDAEKKGGEAGKDWGEEFINKVKGKLGQAKNVIKDWWRSVKEAYEESKRRGEVAAPFQHGGIVPGPIGKPMPIIAHGGERVVPRTGADVYARGAPTININISGSFALDDTARLNELANLIGRTLGRQMELAQLGAGY